MTIWETPAGIVDEGGVVLPAWLNFGITLLGPPANGIMHVSSSGAPDEITLLECAWACSNSTFGSQRLTSLSLHQQS